MSTRSTIAVKLEDNSYRQGYCHWDGYLSNNGQKLLSHYNSQALAELVTSEGDISALHEHYSTGNHADESVTVLCGRDRLELDCGPYAFKDEKDFIKNRQEEEYNYLFQNNQWYVKFGVIDYVPLTQALVDMPFDNYYLILLSYLSHHDNTFN